MPKKVSTSQNKVYVFYNSPHSIKFFINVEKSIIINGCPISEIYTPSGNKFISGKFGITEISESEWSEILRLYSQMPIFTSKRIFSAASILDGKSQAKELENQINGFEQVNVLSSHSVPIEK